MPPIRVLQVRRPIVEVVSKVARVALVAAFVASVLAPFPAPALAQPVCRGANLLTHLKTAKPELHAKIMDAARDEPNGEALLWRIAPPAGSPPETKPSWLFGTIHLTDPRVHALSPAVREALAGARVLALEVDDLSDAALAKVLRQDKGLLQKADASEGLDRLLTSAQWAAFSAVARRRGLPEARAIELRPWYATTLLAVSMCEAERQGAGLKPLDMALRDRALATDTRVVGLETLHGQLAAFAALPEETGLAWLRSSLALYSQIDDLTETLVQLYRTRAIGAAWALEQALAGDDALPPAHLAAVKQALVVRRNRAMRDKALPLLADGGVMIAVGALHLGGRDGLVQLLREKGFAVTPVE